MRVILTIAGFDPSSGAGVSADLKTIAAHGHYGIACITALTVQSTGGVRRVQPPTPDLVRETLIELAADFEIAAVRIGMLGEEAIAKAVADFLEEANLPHVVLDPILASSTGAQLLDPAGVQVLKARLFALAEVVTPNSVEAEFLTGIADPLAAARALQSLGAKNVIVTGGHTPSNTDLLLLASGETHSIAGERIDSNATHGTGCAHATAIACNLASGMDILRAATGAKKYVREAIAASRPLGHGKGPMNHLYRMS